MAKRQSEVLRNLDDSLKLFGFLTLKSCGVVLMFYSTCYALEWGLKLWSAVFGAAGLLMQFGLTGLVAFALSWVENREDEHLVPSAIRYYLGRAIHYVLTGSAPVLYSGAWNGVASGRLERFVAELLRGPQSIEEVVGGPR